MSLKIGFFLLALILGTALLLTTSGILNGYTTNIRINAVASTLGTMGYALGMITVLVLAYFIIGLLFRIFDFLSDTNKKEDDYSEMD